MTVDEPEHDLEQECLLRETRREVDAVARAAPGRPAVPQDLLPDEVREVERTRVGDTPQVGLALSGGGIRSATFALGLLQALQKLRLFDSVDYVSTVSGGGYIGSWLHAMQRRGQLQEALALSGDEPRQVRFLRAYSNYLTPKLGLFSGDTWTAVSSVARNLILTFSILSLSLVTLLFAPWLLRAGFSGLQQSARSSGPMVFLAVAGVLLVVAFAASAENLARPLKDGDYAHSQAGDSMPRWMVQLLVVLPILLALTILGALIGGRPVIPSWGLTLSGGLPPLAAHVINVGLAYAGVWALALALPYALSPSKAAKEAAKEAAGARTSWARALRAWGILSAAAIPGGMVGAFIVFSASVLWTGATNGGASSLWAVPVTVLGFLLAVTVHLGLAGTEFSDETREWWARVGGNVILATLLLTGLSIVAIGVPAFLADLRGWLGETIGGRDDLVKTLLVGAWGALTGGGILAGRSSQTREGSGSWLEWIGRIAPAAFIVGYLSILAVLLHGFVSTTAWWWLVVAFVASAAMAAFLSWRVDLNEFSMHALYRNRLVRCYLGASNQQRNAHPFTGFDRDDDLTLAPGTSEERLRPYPLFNTAINLVGGKNLAWQQRKAASFVFTPDFTGYGYRVDEQGDAGKPLHAFARTGEHGGDPKRGVALTVGLAMATSGAAASPNMGYHTSPTLAFLMTVFNVRLGWWLRNPRFPEVWRNPRERLSLRELLAELLGLTTDERALVYLSDGGHFENLGVYELVRRQVPFIIASDAGQDAAVSFEDLGNAIEKCRADFGIDIEIDVSAIRPVNGRSTAHCAIGSIHYEKRNASLAPGTLVYLKSSLTGDEPTDVLRYASLNPEFPHQTTGDQFFDESQFESYRALGYHIGRQVFDGARPPADARMVDPADVFLRLRQRWTPPAPAPEDAFTKYSRTLNAIWEKVRANERLRFLDGQMFPEWARLMATRATGRDAAFAGGFEGAPPAGADIDYWLPHDEDERRVGFYICTEMLQLMEDVYLEFQLDTHSEHIDNRGWMNLFQHWSWSGMLCATWAVTASIYDPRFQRFCQERLDLRPGKVSVPDDPVSCLDLPDSQTWRSWTEDRRTTEKQHWQRKPAWLNFWEVELVDTFLASMSEPVASTGEPARSKVRLLPIRVTVKSPRRSDGNDFEFTAGYLIARDATDGTRTLLHMRVQNHLRKMGVARGALEALLTAEPGGPARLPLRVEVPAADPPALASASKDEALPRPQAARKIEQKVEQMLRAARSRHTTDTPAVPV
jgi:hypothetical protein